MISLLFILTITQLISISSKEFEKEDRVTYKYSILPLFSFFLSFSQCFPIKIKERFDGLILGERI